MTAGCTASTARSRSSCATGSIRIHSIRSALATRRNRPKNRPHSFRKNWLPLKTAAFFAGRNFRCVSAARTCRAYRHGLSGRQTARFGVARRCAGKDRSEASGTKKAAQIPLCSLALFIPKYGKNRWEMLDNPYNMVYYIIMYHHG